MVWNLAGVPAVRRGGRHRRRHEGRGRGDVTILGDNRELASIPIVYRTEKARRRADSNRQADAEVVVNVKDVNDLKSS